MLVQRACAWDSEGLRPRVQVDRAWNRAQRALLFDEEAAASGDSEDESEADYEDDGDLRGFIAEDDDCLAEVNGTFYRALDQAREGRDASLLSWAQGEPGSGSDGYDSSGSSGSDSTGPAADNVRRRSESGSSSGSSDVADRRRRRPVPAALLESDTESDTGSDGGGAAAPVVALAAAAPAAAQALQPQVERFVSHVQGLRTAGSAPLDLHEVRVALHAIAGSGDGDDNEALGVSLVAALSTERQALLTERRRLVVEGRQPGADQAETMRKVRATDDKRKAKRLERTVARQVHRQMRCLGELGESLQRRSGSIWGAGLERGADAAVASAGCSGAATMATVCMMPPERKSHQNDRLRLSVHVLLVVLVLVHRERNRERPTNEGILAPRSRVQILIASCRKLCIIGPSTYVYSHSKGGSGVMNES